MMAEHVLDTIIQLRYDTYSNWMASSIILKAGEVAIAVIPFNTSIISSDSVPANTPPAIGLKVGDGYSRFDELPWVQAVAGDVYNWAKQSTKPRYNAGEIDGLQAFVEEHSSGGGGGGSTPSTSARIYQLIRGTGDNINKYYLRYRSTDSSEWITDTSTYIDLSQYEKVVDWIGDDLDDYFTLNGRVFSTIYEELSKKNYTDSTEEGKVVVAVSENNGLISVTKKVLNLNELTGILPVSAGGTGITSINENEILIGSSNGTFTKRLIQTELEADNNLATNNAIKTYIDNKTAGLTGAMHYIGEATVEINPTINANVDPNINGYNFRNVQYGDVITYGQKEFVWAGGWHLLGDEGSYAIKGSIVDADISIEANIQQSKILNLAETLAEKVDVIEGKSLSTNDYTTAEKNKLNDIEDNAQVNTIEHIFVNDIERPITVINGLAKSIALSIDVFDEEHATKLDGIQAGAQVNAIEHIFVNGIESVPITYNNVPKSVNLIFNSFTDAERLKLENIEAEAQINKIETIKINNTVYTPDEHKEISINLDPATLQLNVIAGARVPKENNEYDEISITTINNVKILEFARVAKTGDIKDITQSNGEYITLYCGTSTDVI